ncbi:MAG: hypothetical protein QM648_09485 [Solirubrobacterales bacterium]
MTRILKSSIAAALLAATLLAASAQVAPAAPQNCSQALTAVKNALRARSVPRYYAKTASDPLLRSRYRKQRVAADRRVVAARAALKVQCQGVGTTSALDATCSQGIAELDHLYDLRAAAQAQSDKLRPSSSSARRAALQKRISQLDARIAAQNLVFRAACRKDAPAPITGEPIVTAPTTPTAPTGPTGDAIAPAAPGIQLPGTNSAGYNNQLAPSVVIEAPSGEVGGHAQCRLSGGSYAGVYTSFTAVDSPWVVPVLADGRYMFFCRWVDAAGNAGESASVTVTFDRVAPAPPIVAGPSAATSDATPSLNLSGAASGEGYECRSDGGSVSSTGNLYTTAVLAAGPHTVECRVADIAGNRSAFVSANVTIDPSAMGSVTIFGLETAGPDALTLTLVPSGDYVYIGCNLDGGTIYSLTSPVVLPSLAAGYHSVSCRLYSSENVPGPVSTYTVRIVAG